MRWKFGAFLWVVRSNQTCEEEETKLRALILWLDCFASFDFESTVSQLACYWLCILPYPSSLQRGGGKQN
jgi:hypothetical protein